MTQAEMTRLKRPGRNDSCPKRPTAETTQNLMTFYIASCICVQTGQRLLHKSTFSCGMAKLLFFSPNSARSTPVECLSSIAGLVFRPERCSLKDDTFEKLNMMIKCNQQIKSE